MPTYKFKAVKILTKFNFKKIAGRRHDKFTKKIITSDNQKHKIVTTIERHPLIEIKFDTIMKQISLPIENIAPAFECSYGTDDYENHINTLTKEEIRRWGKH